MNLDNLAKMSYTIYIKVSDEEALKKENEYSSTQINSYTHELDNSFIEFSFGETIRKLQQNGYQFVGVGPAPYTHHDWGYAVIFESIDTFEKYWCHIGEWMIDEWRAESQKGK